MKTFLALGDSYTIGEGVSKFESWPFQLTRRFENTGIPFEDPIILAKTGWTSSDLIASLKALESRTLYDYVSLLIGVNNEYDGLDFEQFENEFIFLMTNSLSRVKNGGVFFVVNIPDYGFTPFGRDNQAQISANIDRYNGFIKTQCDKFQVPYFDVSIITREYPDLLVEDNLHPSEKMYKLWVDKIYYLLTE